MTEKKEAQQTALDHLDLAAGEVRSAQEALRKARISDPDVNCAGWAVDRGVKRLKVDLGLMEIPEDEAYHVRIPPPQKIEDYNQAFERTQRGDR